METASLSLSPTSIDVETLITSLPVLESSVEPEFKRLPASPVFSTSVTNSEGVSKKNRWKEYVPYDHNRVILSSDEYTSSLNDDRDYINASFIRGFSSNGGYIAAQGPMLGTVDDFWRMVWSENSHIIVMMSRTVEGYQTRGYKYWPDPGDSLEAAHVIVCTEWEDERATHAIRKFVMRDVKSSESRTVTQLQFLGWPEESSCLPCIPTFVAFWNIFRKIQKDDSRLPVIHCSNGSQRSTLLMALDILCQQVTNKGKVDIFTTVRRLREDRTGSINTLDQYSYLLYCVVEVCSGLCPSIHVDQTLVKQNVQRNVEKAPASRSHSLDVFKNVQQFNRVIGDRFRENIANTSTPLEDATHPPPGGNSNQRGHVAGSHRNTRSQWISSRRRQDKTKSANPVYDASKEKSDEEILEEFKTLSSHQTLWNRITRTSTFFCESEAESNFNEERNGNVRRGSSKVWIPVENDSVPVICLPMNRSAVTTTIITETAPSRLKHSVSLQDTKIMSEISGILPAENKKSFLVTSFMHLMSSDFWQVLFDTGCQTVIRILPERRNEQMGDFPSVETANFNVSVERVACLRPEITETVFLMKPTPWASKLPSKFAQVEDQTIKILNLSGLPINGQSMPCDLLLHLFQFMDTWLDQSMTSLVNVQCSDGLSSCGFFCAAYNVMSNLKAGDDADVYLTCRLIQNNIPDAITQEQYIQLYRICQQYTQTSVPKELLASHSSEEEKKQKSPQLDTMSSLESNSSTD